MWSQLRNIINSGHIPVSNYDDNIFWCGSKTGEYSVKLGYGAQRIKGPITSWPHKLCWNNQLLPKAGDFLWIALHNRILTGDRLKLIGISGPSILIENLKLAIEEVVNGKHKRIFRCYNDWDRSMEKYWRLKDHNPGSVFSNKRVDRKHIRWKAPAPDWFKLNFDGAYRGNLGVSGYGAIIRNVEGDLILGTYSSLGWATNNEAEIHALIAGLSLCVKHGAMVQVVMDSSDYG
ncbi:uncharacterized protein LOC131062636 [Cryptomeria japonica]|uniref:uncharacterized protein LOC131062636 n=1 Tax=Cryptomeria japonica TaxID=3369 RepID=UPI0025AD24B7|nr:uncharacterized protein LOC131062636 [Cryptomeria japonica]